MQVWVTKYALKKWVQFYDVDIHLSSGGEGKAHERAILKLGTTMSFTNPAPADVVDGLVA